MILQAVCICPIGTLPAQRQISICCKHCRNNWECTSGRKNLIWTKFPMLVSYCMLFCTTMIFLCFLFLLQQGYFSGIWLCSRVQGWRWLLVSGGLECTKASKMDFVQVTKPGDPQNFIMCAVRIDPAGASTQMFELQSLGEKGILGFLTLWLSCRLHFSNLKIPVDMPWGNLQLIFHPSLLWNREVLQKPCLVFVLEELGKSFHIHFHTKYKRETLIFPRVMWPVKGKDQNILSNSKSHLFPELAFGSHLSICSPSSPLCQFETLRSKRISQTGGSTSPGRDWRGLIIKAENQLLTLLRDRLSDDSAHRTSSTWGPAQWLSG